ncbi:MAG: GBS Bsp-like repeat-containing protein [Acetobacterium sp.]
MEKIKKRKNWLVVGALLVLSVLILFSWNGFLVEASGTMIVINPGHMDGVDPGAVNSSNGIREVDLNNALAIKTVATLRANGYNAMLSHPVPGNPGLPTLLATTPDYDVYTKTICDTANAKGADLLLSIHHNSGGDASGYELYWSSYHTTVDNDGLYEVSGLWPSGATATRDISPSPIALSSKALANSLNENFKCLDYVPCRNKIVERDDGIIRRTSMPSVLIEAGFVSNSAEAVKMADGSNQQKMADQILKSVQSMFGVVYEPMTASSVDSTIAGNVVTATITGINAPNGIRQIQVPVWSELNGQDDIKWYTATAQSNGSYSVSFDIKDHNYDSGIYILHYYGTDNNNKLTMLGDTTINVKADLMTATSIVGSVSGSKITATIKGIRAPNGVKLMQVPVWSEVNGQDDLKWYIATVQGDGSYSVTIDTKDHNFDAGVYNIHCYGMDNNNQGVFLGNATVQVNSPTITATAVQASASGSKITATIKGIKAPNGVKLMQVPIWSDINGQDDLKWYIATVKSDGSYSVTIDTKDHNYDGGIYNIHCYGTDNSNTGWYLGNATVEVNNPTVTASSVTASVSGSKITAIIKGITAPNGIKLLQVPIWSEVNGQDDLKWYIATAQSDGSFSVTIDTKDHNNDIGVYNIHCYGTDNSNNGSLLGKTTVNVTIQAMTANTIEASRSGSKITATIKGITATNGIKLMQVPIWSEVNGQDDLKWYIATAQSDGSYSVTIDTKDHNNDIGDYNIHCYGTDNSSNGYFLGSATASVTMDPMTATSVVASTASNTITATITGITTPNGIKQVQVPVWSEINGQDDLVWYIASLQNDGSYSVTIETKNHNDDPGIYNIHCYGIDNNDKLNMIGNTTVNVKIETMIMGQTTVSAQQLINYYKATGATYPQEYNDLGVNLETFIDLYIQEANAEGVRAEVAFAQAMLETGRLKFGGDVKVGQFNFAGLGATGGVPGFDFAAKYGDNVAGLRTGIRGHIQHLKCYGCNLPLNQTKVDPRWSDSIRLRATTVEGLSGTWAADLNYAPKIVTIMKSF